MLAIGQLANEYDDSSPQNRGHSSELYCNVISGQTERDSDKVTNRAHRKPESRYLLNKSWVDEPVADNLLPPSNIYEQLTWAYY